MNLMNNAKLLLRRIPNRTVQVLPALVAGLLFLALELIAGGVLAQELPDAGHLLQENLPSQLQPVKPSVDFHLEGQPIESAPPDGPQVRLNRIILTGNTLYTEENLLAVLGDVLGQSYDLAGLRQLANRISRYYRANGYPFAHAYLPEQNMADGALTIVVIEGRYGTVKATGDEALAAGAQGFLKAIEPGSVIESGSLERSILILGDQPGVKVVPVMRPATETGSGDLDVRVMKAPRVMGQVTADNHGNRYSGEYRTQVELRLHRAIVFGDEIFMRGLYSNEDLWLGQLAYSLPLGRSGLRGWASYAHTDYDLRAPFEGYTGTAKIGAVELSYPLIRSQNSNLIASAGYQHKDLDDELSGSSYNESSSNSWPLGLQFDHRDDLIEGGITYGGLTLIQGRLKSDTEGVPEGGFTKANAQLARIQNLPAAFSLLVRVSGQWADQELDSSESFILGGAYGVRAYPQGEGSGNKGWVGQVELRYTIVNFVPYLFYDSGQRYQDAEDNRRRIAGTGIGLRYSYNNLSLNLASAWKTTGGDSTSDADQRDPRIWFTVSYRF
jgi:hemolysin activation/secretion protein